MYNLSSHLKNLEKEELKKPRAEQKKKIIKIRTEMNEIERKSVEKINVTKSFSFERVGNKLANF